MSVKYDALCYGAISLDISGRVQRFSPGAQESATDYETFPGGDATLVALTLAGLGWKVALAGGPVGHDPMGDYLRQMLADSGIDLYAINMGKTSVSAVSVDSAGERTAITFHENTPLEEIPVPLELVSQSRSLYACGCYGRNSGLLGEKARQAGLLSLLNANSSNMDIIGSFDVAIASEDNVSALSPDAAKAAAAMRAGGAGVAVVTKGAQGCVCCAEQCIVLPARQVSAVDCTGAGAAFAAGFIHAGLMGMELRDRLKYASAAGALKCTIRGSYRRISREELEQFTRSG